MKFRVRFGKQRFLVEVKHANGTVLNVIEAICKVLRLRDISSIQISLNGVDIIEERDKALSSLGLVNGDLVYALPSNPHESFEFDKNDVMLSQLIDMGFDKELAEHALLQVNYASIEAAVETITNNDVKEAFHYTAVDDSCEMPSTSKTSNIGDETRHIADNDCNPVFCRDGVSTSLETLYSTSNVKTQHHAVLVLIHALMLESGFCLKSESEGVAEGIPDRWNNSNVVRLSYIHNLSSSIPCQLVSSSLGPFTYAHVWSEESKSNAYYVKLVASQYIKGDVPITAGAKAVYKKLHKVSRIVKNELVHPLLANIQSCLGITSPLSLNGLPPEIQLIILSQLTARGLLSLSETCKTFNVLCYDEKLWQFFCQRDFGVENKSVDCWRKQYKLLYQRQQQQPLILCEYPFGMPWNNPFLRRPQLPQILGGPHDLFPPDLLVGQPRDELPLRTVHPDDRSRSDLRLRSNDRATRGTFFASFWSSVCHREEEFVKVKDAISNQPDQDCDGCRASILLSSLC